MMVPDDDTCYRAVSGRDPRFDGWFFTAVTSTGIYCRPSCPALTPRRENVRFFPSAAGAQRGGFRACKRCRPDACPGSPEWNVRADVTGRALRLIADGVVDRDGVPGLARRLNYSERQLNRTLLAEVGAGPLALARANRAQTARVLLETTDLPAADVAFAAGFASVRQFNETVRDIFAETPSSLRERRGRHNNPEQRNPDPGTLELRLAYRGPMDVEFALRWLGWHAVAGVESFTEDGPTYARTLDLPHAVGRVWLEPGGPDWVRARVQLADQRDLTTAVSRVRRLLDLDADPSSIDDALSADPALRPLVRDRPGMRSPGHVDGAETAVRTVVGQQVSLAGARTVLARIVAAHGRHVYDDEPGMLFPSAAALADVDPLTLPMPRARARAVVAVAAAFADGAVALDPGVDLAQVRGQLLAIAGVGPWTADYLRMRSGHPDVLLATDLAARRISDRLGLEVAGGGEHWAPWRSYVTHHLWALALTEMAHPKSKETSS